MKGRYRCTPHQIELLELVGVAEEIDPHADGRLELTAEQCRLILERVTLNNKTASSLRRNIGAMQRRLENPCSL